MNPFQDIFDAQKSYFTTGVTRTRAWRIDQLDRLAEMLNEHDKRFYEDISNDLKTALQEKIFEVAATLGTIHGYDSLTHPKSILFSPADVTLDHLFPPYDMSKVQALERWQVY